MPCVFADGWPASSPVSVSSSEASVDRANTHTERLEKVLYHTGVSKALLANLSLDAYCKNVSMLLSGISLSRILPRDDHIAENSLVVSVKHQDCTRSTTKQSMSTRVTRLESSS